MTTSAQAAHPSPVCKHAVSLAALGFEFGARDASVVVGVHRFGVFVAHLLHAQLHVGAIDEAVPVGVHFGETCFGVGDGFGAADLAVVIGIGRLHAAMHAARCTRRLRRCDCRGGNGGDGSSQRRSQYFGTCHADLLVGCGDMPTYGNQRRGGGGVDACAGSFSLQQVLNRPAGQKSGRMQK